jgi:hypothetical protein
MAVLRNGDSILMCHRHPAPRRAPDEILLFEEESTRLSVWFIDYGEPVHNRAPDEHDDVRWLTFEDATHLESSLADPVYVALIRVALHP